MGGWYGQGIHYLPYTLQDCVIMHNGCGVQLLGSGIATRVVAFVRNCYIAENGKGIYSQFGEIVLRNCTMPITGSGVCNWRKTSSIEIVNSIVWGNRDGSIVEGGRR